MCSLRLMQFNVENLFLFSDQRLTEQDLTRTESEWQKLSGAIMPNKPLKKAIEIRNIIQDVSPDLIILNEVGGEESLKNFARVFLKDQYSPHLRHGNSDRGIDIGFLLHEKSNFTKPLLLSHRDRKLILPSDRENPYKEPLYFSRDLAELRLFRKDQTSPSLIVLGVHLKSKMDRLGIDSYCRYRREAEVLTLLDIYQRIEEETEGKTPILIAGDFNGNIYQDAEFAHLLTDHLFVDALQAAEIPESQRYTQIQIPNLGPAFQVQLDYMLLPSKWRPLVQAQKTHVYRFKDESGLVMPPPNSASAKFSLPSDHYPVCCSLEIP